MSFVFSVLFKQKWKRRRKGGREKEKGGTGR